MHLQLSMLPTSKSLKKNHQLRPKIDFYFFFLSWFSDANTKLTTFFSPTRCFLSQEVFSWKKASAFWRKNFPKDLVSIQSELWSRKVFPDFAPSSKVVKIWSKIAQTGRNNFLIDRVRTLVNIKYVGNVCLHKQSKLF